MDGIIINMLNALGHSTFFFTKIVLLIVSNNLVKGGAIVAVLWYLWFNEKSKNSHSRAKIIITLYGCIIAIVVGRGLAKLFPFRARPMLNPEFDFTFQIAPLSDLATWSSFPSDHAVLFFSLATGIFLVSKKWGIISYAYVFFIICFPRIYLGFHYPTDILAGAAIGIFIIWGISVLKIFKIFSEKTLALSLKFPGIFYACFFILSYQIATLFEASRDLISGVFHYIFQ
ncbi:membrane-associated phospholipid phosphatase [Aquipluma nitroreducens]|uniref:Membrane-associated phospholipid phosphatase n=1 Tax=Aquipluma nitroreducens TaxID=2010828 RepID=A0A5K7SH43_9BACT|nr:phosphatase PAP2 family protein [Aquipluma nitroreducens]BBE20564.1 membrane-associated phospholipid phosphatase [Aquipluma nitroreducens]